MPRTVSNLPDFPRRPSLYSYLFLLYLIYAQTPRRPFSLIIHVFLSTDAIIANEDDMRVIFYHFVLSTNRLISLLTPVIFNYTILMQGKTWVGFDDTNASIQKANYIVSNGLGGAMFWDLPSDDFRHG